MRLNDGRLLGTAPRVRVCRCDIVCFHPQETTSIKEKEQRSLGKGCPHPSRSRLIEIPAWLLLLVLSFMFFLGWQFN